MVHRLEDFAWQRPRIDVTALQQAPDIRVSLDFGVRRDEEGSGTAATRRGRRRRRRRDQGRGPIVIGTRESRIEENDRVRRGEVVIGSLTIVAIIAAMGLDRQRRRLRIRDRKFGDVVRGGGTIGSYENASYRNGPYLQ